MREREAERDRLDLVADTYESTEFILAAPKFGSGVPKRERDAWTCFLLSSHRLGNEQGLLHS